MGGLFSFQQLPSHFKASAIQIEAANRQLAPVNVAPFLPATNFIPAY